MDIEIAAQKSAIFSGIIKENLDLYGEYLLSSFNDAIDKYNRQCCLENGNQLLIKENHLVRFCRFI